MTSGGRSGRSPAPVAARPWRTLTRAVALPRWPRLPSAVRDQAALLSAAGALAFLPGGLLVTEAAMTGLLVAASQGVDQPTATAATDAPDTERAPAHPTLVLAAGFSVGALGSFRPAIQFSNANPFNDVARQAVFPGTCAPPVGVTPTPACFWEASVVSVMVMCLPFVATSPRRGRPRRPRSRRSAS